jgi:septal ring factor EnvC (AmiA/AmiB activator)
MEWYSIISSIVTVILGGGWFIYYRANKIKANGEAMQAEAEGWAKQQEVYHNTIDELKATCEYIATDRNLLRDENTKLREENTTLRNKINEMEDQMLEMRKEISRLGRRIEAISREERFNSKRQHVDGNIKKG